MNEIIQELQSTVAALRAELTENASRLRALEEVIAISHSDGTRQVSIECHSLAIRTREETPGTALKLGANGSSGFLNFLSPRGDHTSVLHLGADTDGGFLTVRTTDGGHTALHLGTGQHGSFLNLHSPAAPHHSAIFLGMDGKSIPVLKILGPDKKARVLLTIQEDHGTLAALAPGLLPGALMRAQDGGGMVAVCQRDGKARGILLHHEDPPGPDGAPVFITELAFAGPDNKTCLALTSDPAGTGLKCSLPDSPHCLMLAARNDSSTLVLRSKDDATTATIAAAPGIARIFTFCGSDPITGREAALCSDVTGSSLSLRYPDGPVGVDFHVSSEFAQCNINRPNSTTALQCAVNNTGYTRFAITSPTAGHDVMVFDGGDERTCFSIASPAHAGNHAVTIASGSDSLSTALIHDGNAAVALIHGPHGGSVIASGHGPAAGHASLNGGDYAGSLFLTPNDGTPLLSLDASDHGGRFNIYNDLGFARITMGVVDESAGLHLNYAGQKGVSAIATSKGGLLLVCDPDGNVRATVPPHEDDDS